MWVQETWIQSDIQFHASRLLRSVFGRVGVQTLMIRVHSTNLDMDVAVEDVDVELSGTIPVVYAKDRYLTESVVQRQVLYRNNILTSSKAGQEHNQNGHSA